MELTYTEVEGTRGVLPDGFHHVDRKVVIGHGRAAYSAASTALTSWEMHRGSGLRVTADSATADVGSTVVMGLGPIRIPCRVVYVVAEQNRTGFAYGTLTGHPEQGEECFLVEYDGDGDENGGVVYAHIIAFSRPGRWFTKLGGPLGRLVQRTFTGRYIAALRRSANL